MSGDQDGTGAPQGRPPTIHLSHGGLAFGLALCAVFLAGDVLLPGWLSIDLDCLDGEYRRRAKVIEIAQCGLASGPLGWIYLAWFAAPLLLFGWWLRRALRRAR